ncbi:MAG: hypothetical protein ACR2OZ_09985 [Verrucomicrobiales bacterium]
MKKPTLSLALALLAAGFATAVNAETTKDACASLSTTVKEEVSAKPEQVLVIISEKIAANPSCACEIVQAAIKASKAEADLVGEIVFTAVSAAPAESTTIAECAVAVSPQASETVKSALQRAMSDKNPVGKSVDKGVVAQDTQSDLGDFGLSPVNIGGVYLVYPGGGAIGSRLKRVNGRLVLIGPDGETVFVEEGTVPERDRPLRRPRPIIIRVPVPSPTAGTP